MNAKRNIEFASEATIEHHTQLHLIGKTLPSQVRNGADPKNPYFVDLYGRIATRLEELIAERRQSKSVSYRAIGVSNDVTTCDCCGREDLTKTVVIQTLEDNAPMGEGYYGVVCASKLTGASKRRVSQAVRALDSNTVTKPWELFA